MSKHVWLLDKMMPGTLDLGRQIYRKARTYGKCGPRWRSILGQELGLNVKESLRLTGYVLESLRQKSLSSTGGEDGIIEAAANSNHRWVNGKNRHNYLLAGLKWRWFYTALLAKKVGMRPSTPFFAICDKLLEENADEDRDTKDAINLLIEVWDYKEEDDPEMSPVVRKALPPRRPPSVP